MDEVIMRVDVETIDGHWYKGHEESVSREGVSPEQVAGETAARLAEMMDGNTFMAFDSLTDGVLIIPVARVKVMKVVQVR